MTVITRAERRRTTTPNATMTTLASPTLGSAEHALWRVTMRPGQVGPLHVIDQEQIWTVVAGGATVEVGDTAERVGPDDTIVLAPDVVRRIVADPAAGLEAIVLSGTPAHAKEADGTDHGTPAWMA